MAPGHRSKNEFRTWHVSRRTGLQRLFLSNSSRTNETIATRIKWTKPPEKHSYLQANSTKRSASGSRKKKGPVYRALIAIAGGNDLEHQLDDIAQSSTDDENSDEEVASDKQNGSEDEEDNDG